MCKFVGLMLQLLTLVKANKHIDVCWLSGLPLCDLLCFNNEVGWVVLLCFVFEGGGVVWLF